LTDQITAGVAVADTDEAADGYEQLLGRPADRLACGSRR
jgi:hypothetical protein